MRKIKKLSFFKGREREREKKAKAFNLVIVGFGK